MKHRVIIIFLLCLLVPPLSLAQSLTNKERRKINSQALLLVEEYERYASVYDDDAVYFLKNLFTDDAQIVSDMMGAQSYMKSISAGEYIDQLRSNSVNTTTVIKDVRRGQLKYNDGMWHIPISFRKDLSYIDKNGYIFSVEDYYSTDISVMMDLVYDANVDRCFIASMSSSIDSDKQFPEGRFYIIDSNNEELKYNRYFESLMFDSKPIEYNSLGQAFVAADKKPSVNDIDVEVNTEIVTEGFNYDVVSFTFKSRSLRLKPYLSFAPFYAYKIKNKKEISKNITDKSGAIEGGLDMGFTFPTGRSGKMGLYIGAGLSKSHLELSLKNNISYTYNAPKYNKNTDSFEEQVYKYNISNVKERVEYLDLYVPLYLGWEYCLGNNMLLSFNLGAKAYLNMSAKSAIPYSVEYEYTVNNVANSNRITLTPQNFIIPNKYAKNPFDISAIANLGLDVNLFKNRIYIMIQAGYEYGITDSYVSNSLVYNGADSAPVIIPDGKTDGKTDGNDVAVSSPISGIQTQRNAVWLTTGLKFKL